MKKNWKKNFQNRKILITGASEGIGLSVARFLAQSGADLILVSRRIDLLREICRDLKSLALTQTQHFIPLAVDVAEMSSVETIQKSLGEHRFYPDILIQCAGIAYPSWIENAKSADVEHMLKLNVLGLFHVVQAVLPVMRKAKKPGYIINTSSMAGYVGLFGYTGYCASKYAAIGFSEALRRELKPEGIVVSVLCPPNTRTPGLERENKMKPPEVLATEEKAKVLNPEEVAAYLLDRIPKKRFWIIPTMDGRLAEVLRRYFPWLVDVIIKMPQKNFQAV